MSEQHKVEFAWWVEIVTTKPCCIYYFGPFDTAAEAEELRPGYVEDLQQEGTQGILWEVKQCKPKCLTIVLDEEFNDSELTGQPAIYQFYPNSLYPLKNRYIQQSNLSCKT